MDIANLTFFTQKKLLTRNRFRRFKHIVFNTFVTIFNVWNVNLLLKQIKFTVII